MFHRRKNNWSKGLIAGMIGGAAASWVMDEAQAGLSKLKRATNGDGKSKPQPESGGNRGEPATARAADAISRSVFHHELGAEEKPIAGSAVHYAFGTAVGGLYGVLMERWPRSDFRAAAGFGPVLWLASDEVAVPLAGLSKRPREYPISAHASALAAHVVYALTVELVRRGLRRGYLAG
jgi:hypothetical protein